jgi:uncharacterized Zn-binding protein involved in type VI secretion
MGFLARMFDPVTCPADVHGWSILPVTGLFMIGSLNVLANSRPAIRMGDGGPHVLCPGPNVFIASAGSPTVLINSLPAVRALDVTTHCGASPGFVMAGLTSPNIMVGPL